MSYDAYSSTALVASQTIANFQHVRSGHILPKAGASLAETTGAHDIGSTTYRWDKLYTNSIATTITVSAPVTFTGDATFNTTTTFSGGVFPTRISVAYIENISVTPADLTGTAFILDWNTVTVNTIDGASLTTNQVSLPSGVYVAYVRTPVGAPAVSAPDSISGMFVFDVTSSTTVADVSSVNGATVNYGTNIARFSILTQSSVEIRVDCANASRRTYSTWVDGQFKNLLGQMTIFKVS